jgi:hypothetical protein
VFHAVEWGQVTRRGARGCGVGGARDTPPVRRRGRPLDLRHVSRLLTAVTGEASHGALYAFTHASGFWFGRLMVAIN